MYQTFGQVVLAARRRQKLSIEDVAQRVGLSRSTVYLIDVDRYSKPIAADKVVRYYHALGDPQILTFYLENNPAYCLYRDLLAAGTLPAPAVE